MKIRECVQRFPNFIIMHISLTLSTLLIGAGTTYASKSTGCGHTLSKDLSKDQKSGSSALTFQTSDGTERNYLLHIPDGYDVNTPAGLIWSYHGRGKSAEHQEKISKFSKSSYNANHIVIYPQGTPKNARKSGNSRRQDRDDEDDYEDDEEEEYGPDDDDEEYDNSGSNGKGDDGVESSSDGGQTTSKKGAWQGDPAVQTDDVKFTMELLDNITKSFCIDEDRIYASGISNGGGFVANILACDATASTKFAAFASASGAYYQQGVKKDDCKPEKVAITCNNNGARTPLIVTAGGKDKTIPNGGGERRKACLPSVEHFTTAMAQRDGLDAKSTQSKFNNSDVVHHVYGKDTSMGMVQYYYVPNMGHKWPTGDKKTHVSATKVFMEFFAQWNLTARATAADSVSQSSSATSGAASQMHALGFEVLGLLLVCWSAFWLV